MRMILCAALIGAASCGEAQREAGEIGLDPSAYPTAAGYLSCLEGQGAVVSAHRGGPAPGFPENAIETFANTLAQVPALIETDVRATADGVLVLLHDETVDRTTNGSGAIADMTLAQAKSLRLVDGDGQLTDYRIPTLAEALSALRGTTVIQLDVKRGIGLRQVVEAVEDADAESHAAIITYTDNGARIVATASEDVTVVAGADQAARLQDLAGNGVPADRLIVWTGITRGNLDATFLAELDARGIPASAGALGYLDDRAEAGDVDVYLMLEEAGVDIVATDRPVEAARALGITEVAAAAAACARPT